MSREYFLPFPDDKMHWLQACTWHPCKVISVKDPTGSGMVKVECPGLWGKEASNWIPSGGNGVGSDKTERKQTGSWIPAQPGQMGFICFPGGNYRKPMFMGGGPWMSDKGSAS